MIGLARELPEHDETYELHRLLGALLSLSLIHIYRDRMFDCPQNLREEEMFEVPEWAANKVVYQIFPSRFAASQPIDKELWYKAPITSKDNLHGDLRGIMDHLDHIQKLGIDVVYLTPIFKSDSKMCIRDSH